MADTARAAAALGVEQVNGFTGSAVWHLLYSFPPNDFAVVERGYQDFAERWGPILDVFEREGVRFGLEVHPTEIAYDFVTTRKTLAAIDRRPVFGINLDPSHFAHQFLDAAAFVDWSSPTASTTFTSRTRVRRLDGRRSILGVAPQLRRREPRLGLRLAGTRRRRLRGVLPGAQPDRLHRVRSPSSGRTRAWTASAARRTRSPTSAAPTSRRPQLAFDAAMQRRED